MSENKLDLAALKARVLAEMRKPQRKEYEAVDLTRKTFMPLGGEELLALIEAAEERDKARSLLLHAVDIMCEITFQDRTDGTIISDMMDWANTWRREIMGIKPEFWPDATQEKIKAVYSYRKRAETAEAEVERLREALAYAESQFRALAKAQRARRNIANDSRPLLAVADHLRAALEHNQ